MKFILQTTRKIGFAAFVLGVCLFSTQTAFSQNNIVWNGGAGTNVWSDPTNWIGGVVPGTADSATITGADVVVTATTTILKLKVYNSGGLGKVTINSGVTLNVNSLNAASPTSTGLNAAVMLFGGIIENSGTLAITGRQSLDALRFDNPTSGTASSTYTGSGTLTCDTQGAGTSGGGSANTGAAVTFAQTSGTATFTLNSSGTYNFSVYILSAIGGTKSVFYCLRGTAQINGTGIIATSGGVRSIRIIPLAAGDAPNLTIESGVTMNLSSTITGATVGMVLLDHSTTTGAAATVTNKGTLNFSGAACSPIHMNNPAVSGANKTTFINDGTININGSFSDAATTGCINMIGGVSTMSSGNVFTNTNTINFNTTASGNSTKPLFYNTSSPTTTITNSGTITVGTNGAPATAFRLGTPTTTTVNNTGTITIGAGNITCGTALVPVNNNTGGILNLNAAGVNSNALFVNSGGAFNANASHTISRLTYNSGTVTVADGTSLTIFALTLTNSNIVLGTGNIVISSTTGSFITAGASGYIVTNGTGTVAFQGFTGAKTFPIGTASAYAPVIVTNNASARTIAARVGSTFSGTPVATNKMVQLQWDITPTIPADMTANNADLTLQWPASVHGGSFNPALATEIAHYTGTWNEFKLATVAGSGPYTASATGFTSFSPFAVSNQNALSVELTTFKATPLSKINVLTWETASEVNNKGFDVQRQTTTGAWESLGFVNGTGKAATYTFEDKTPLSISYYRLRQIDFDGKETLSKIVSVSQDTKGRISITPNPTSDKVNINLNQNDASNQTATIVLSDMTGRQVLTQTTTASVFQLDLSNLAKGMYVVTVQSNNALYQEKIIRQ